MNRAALHSQAPLRLADHIRICVAGAELVLLDLERSRYFGLGPAPSEVILHLNEHSTVQEDAPRVVDALVRRRILTRTPRTGSRPSRELPRPDQTFVDAPGVAIRPSDVCRFAVALASAAMWVRCRSFHTISAAVQSLQGHCGGTASDTAMRHAVTLFNRMRPFAFTAKEQCLFDSLALVVFLTRQGFLVRWVVGVSTRPFKAHSWVQRNDEVLNDVHEHVRRFTPILVV